MLSTRRLQAVAKLVVKAVSAEVLHAVVRHRGLKVLYMRTTDLSSSEPGLLARAILPCSTCRCWHYQQL